MAVVAQYNVSTRSWNSTFRCTSTTSRTTGSTSSPLQSLHTTTPRTQQPWSHLSLLTRVFIPNSKCPLKVSIETVVSEAAHLVAIDLQGLHQYLYNQMSCALKQSVS